MKALLALIAVTAVWGVTFVQVKDAVAIYPLFAFLAVRFAIASATLALPAAKRVRGLGRIGGAGGAFLGLLLAAGYALQTAGLERTTVSSTGFITGMYVVLTPLIALAALSLAHRARRVGRRGARDGGPGDALGDSRGLGRREICSCSPAAAVYSLQIVLMERYAPRFDALRFHVRRDGGGVPRAAASSRSRSAIWACRAAGRCGARCS